MLDAAIKALSQILSPPMRSILWRSIGLALVLIVVLAIGLQRLLSWFATSGEGWAEAMLGPGFHTPLDILGWVISIAAGFGVVFGAVFLMPAITSLVASVFVDEVADHVEREHYPAERPGTALPFGIAMTEGVKTALLTVLVYLIALPFVFIAGAGFIAFFIATAWLLGREYFELAAMRFRSPAEAKAMRKQNAALVFTAGLGDRRLRVDPDRQPGDAIVRHGVHGSHAQAALWPAAGIDRTFAQDQRAGGLSLQPVSSSEGRAVFGEPRRMQQRVMWPILRDAAQDARLLEEDGAASWWIYTVFSGQRQRSLIRQTSQRGLRARQV